MNKKKWKLKIYEGGFKITGKPESRDLLTELCCTFVEISKHLIQEHSEKNRETLLGTLDKVKDTIKSLKPCSH